MVSLGACIVPQFGLRSDLDSASAESGGFGQRFLESHGWRGALMYVTEGKKA